VKNRTGECYIEEVEDDDICMTWKSSDLAIVPAVSNPGKNSDSET
jgi:hypothetical protein